jgi:hypothetical protein
MSASFGIPKGIAGASENSTDGDKCILNSSIYQRIFQATNDYGSLANINLYTGRSPINIKE